MRKEEATLFFKELFIQLPMERSKYLKENDALKFFLYLLSASTTCRSGGEKNRTVQLSVTSTLLIGFVYVRHSRLSLKKTDVLFESANCKKNHASLSSFEAADSGL